MFNLCYLYLFTHILSVISDDVCVVVQYHDGSHIHVEQEQLSLRGGTYLSPPTPPGFSEVRVVRSFVFCVMFCKSLFVRLSFFFWSLSWLSVFESRLLVTPFGIFNSLIFLRKKGKSIVL